MALPQTAAKSILPKLKTYMERVEAIEKDALKVIDSMPISAGDPDGLKKQIYPLNATAFERLETIVTSSNTTARNFVSDLANDVRKLHELFEDLQNQITRDMSSVRDETESSNESYLKELNDPDGQLERLLKIAHSLNKLSADNSALVISDSLSLSPENNKFFDIKKKATSDSRGVLDAASRTSMAGKDAVLAAQIAAQSAAEKIGKFEKTGLQDQELTANGLNGNLEFQTKLVANGVENQVNDWTKISADMATVVGDLSDNVKAEAEQKSNTARVVFNDIIRAQTNVKRIMGSVAEKAAKLAEQAATEAVVAEPVVAEPVATEQVAAEPAAPTSAE
jgi:hypothetical protein